MNDNTNTVIEVNGCRVDTAKVSNEYYIKALEIGLYALVITGEIDVRSILADREVKGNVIKLSPRRIVELDAAKDSE